MHCLYKTDYLNRSTAKRCLKLEMCCATLFSKLRPPPTISHFILLSIVDIKNVGNKDLLLSSHKKLFSLQYLNALLVTAILSCKQL